MHDDASERVYHISHRGQRYGPLSRVELSNRTLTHDMLAWREGMPEWLPIGQIPELEPYVRHAATTRTTVAPRPTGAGRPATPQTQPPGPIVVPPPPAPPAPRSGAATTIGILNIVIASLTLLCWPFAIIGTFMNESDGTPLADVFQRPAFLVGQAATLGLGLVLAVPMLIAGIGLVRRRAWGRTAAVGCAWCGLALQAVHLVFVIVAAILPLLGIAAELDDPAIWGGAFGAMIGALAGACGGVVYDAVVLFVMANRDVRRSLS